MPQYFSSIHFFHTDTEKVIRLFTREVDDDLSINNVISGHTADAFTLYQECPDPNMVPRCFKKYFDTVLSLYNHYVPPEIVKKDFARIGAHLSIWGDIICQPECVSVITPRLYFENDGVKQFLFGLLKDYVRHMKCRIFYHSLAFMDDGRIECRFYFMNKVHTIIACRNSDGTDDYSENMDSLKDLFPGPDWTEIFAQTDPVKLSATVENELGVFLDGPEFEEKRQKLTYVETFRLYDIYHV